MIRIEAPQVQPCFVMPSFQYMPAMPTWPLGHAPYPIPLGTVFPVQTPIPYAPSVPIPRLPQLYNSRTLNYQQQKPQQSQSPDSYPKLNPCNAFQMHETLTTNTPIKIVEPLHKLSPKAVEETKQEQKESRKEKEKLELPQKTLPNDNHHKNPALIDSTYKNFNFFRETR